MDEPHQRVRSGKLRKAYTQPGSSRESTQQQQHRRILVGIESATPIDPLDPDDERALYAQTPTSLTDTQVDILNDVAKGLGLNDPTCIDKEWRRTWNIGAWHVGRTVSISANIIQPNVCNVWANITTINASTIKAMSTHFSSMDLERSKCSVIHTGSLIQLKGRWTPHLLDSLYTAKVITPKSVDMTYVNITHSRLFFWVIIDEGHKYLCTPSKDTAQFISRYLPNWSFDVEETSAGGSLSIKLEKTCSNDQNPKSRANNSSQLTVSSIGWLQYVGRRESVAKVYEALAIAIRSIVHSPHLPAFMESLEYKYPMER
jgi:hypothetical protein